MGKKYYCEYCDKRFKDDVNIRQKHLNGLAHQTARNDHYAKYKGKIDSIVQDQKCNKQNRLFRTFYRPEGSPGRRITKEKMYLVSIGLLSIWIDVSLQSLYERTVSRIAGAR